MSFELHRVGVCVLDAAARGRGSVKGVRGGANRSERAHLGRRPLDERGHTFLSSLLGSLTLKALGF